METNQVYKVKTPSMYAGSFYYLKDGKESENFSCRETFSHYFTRKVSEILFTHKPNVTGNIQKFFQRIETILGLKNNKVVVEKTNRPNISKITVPDWWLKYPIRRQLFTVLLRSAQNYTEKVNDEGVVINNFLESLYSDKYAKDTKNAIDHFLKGNTFCKKDVVGGGWKSFGTKYVGKELVKNLIAPPKKVVEIFAKDLVNIVED